MKKKIVNSIVAIGLLFAVSGCMPEDSDDSKTEIDEPRTYEEYIEGAFTYSFDSNDVLTIKWDKAYEGDASLVFISYHKPNVDTDLFHYTDEEYEDILGHNYDETVVKSLVGNSSSLTVTCNPNIRSGEYITYSCTGSEDDEEISAFSQTDFIGEFILPINSDGHVRVLESYLDQYENGEYSFLLDRKIEYAN